MSGESEALMRADLVHAVLTQLVVRPDGSGGLVVDARAVAGEYGPEVWGLDPTEDGDWAHWPSGESGPLGVMLWAIASSYADGPTSGDAG